MQNVDGSHFLLPLISDEHDFRLIHFYNFTIPISTHSVSFRLYVIHSGRHETHKKWKNGNQVDNDSLWAQ